MPAAVEFVGDRDGRVFFDASEKIGPKVAPALIERGVVGRAMPQGDILGFAPPLRLDARGGRYRGLSDVRRRGIGVYGASVTNPAHKTNASSGVAAERHGRCRRLTG